MWLSKAIEKDSQTTDALRELAQLAGKYKDATKLPEGSKFFSTEIRWFRPSVFWYLLFIVVFGVAGYFRSLAVEDFGVEKWLDVMIWVIVPIFVLAVTITNLARSFSESVKFAGEYFNEVCRMELYCCLTLITMLVTILSSVIVKSKIIPFEVIGCCAGISLGATLSCITGIAFIIRETIRCAESTKAVQAATNYAARKMSYALVGKHYLTLWMTKYSEILNNWCQQDFKAIKPTSQYFSSFWNDGNNQEDIYMGFKINIHKGAIDYNFEALREIDNVLKNNGSELFLYPHKFQKDTARLGTIQYSQGAGVDETICRIKQIAKKGCRFHRDKIQEMRKRFWKEHFSKLENALRIAIRDNDTSQMYSYLDSLVWVIEAVEKARKDEVVRKANDILDECWDLIDLYRRSLRQILLDGKELKHRDKANSFTEMLIDSLNNQVTQMLHNGDWRTLKLITWLTPTMYGEYETCDIDKNSALWDRRARFGGFYGWANGLFEEHCAEVNEKDQTKMRIVLHEGATRWLLIADKKKDGELVSSLCSAAKEIAFGDEGICFKQKELACQHLILLGKMISRYLNDEGVVYEDVMNLRSDPLERDLKIDFEELASFYLEHQVPHEGHSEYLRLFVNYVPEGRPDPLRGIGGGHSWGMGLGGYEMALSFFYLGIFALSSDEKPVIRAIDFLSGEFENAMKQIKKMEGKVAPEDLIDFHKGYQTLEEWVKNCRDMHKQQEAQKIAESQIEEEVWRNYGDGFQKGLKESVPFVDYCVKKGYVEESDDASMKTNWHMPKELFLDRSNTDTVRKGDSFGNKVGHNANSWTVRSLIDYKDQENDVEKDVGIKLIHDDEARKKASKEVQKAVAWLNSTGCSAEQGLIILRGIGPDVLHLFEESEYKPAWREKGMEKGFEGYYHGYPVLYLRGLRGHPLCVAMDLRDWRGLEACPKLLNENQSGKVLLIRERNKDEIDKAIEKGTNEIQAKGYCVVELELFWKAPKKKPKQKVLPFVLPPLSESTVKEAIPDISDGK
ncbi:MAG: hypothetical protein PVH77_03850 [Phycisphaerales bacterium]|jgi:hypothetical protein